MKVRFLDLGIKNKKEINQNLKIYKKFLRKGVFVLGKPVEKFENKISKFIGKKYTASCSSGTNAIYLALKALGIKKGDHVLVPCLSWASTFTAVKMVGAEPIGVDIDNDYLINIDQIKKRITNKTKAIILVYFTGHYKSFSEIKTFLKKKNISIIEDCAQSFGAKTQKNVNGSFGDIACFSMNPMKIFSAFGDAGAVSTNSKKIYDTLCSLRYVGTLNKEMVINPDLNHKIDTLQAIILTQKLKNLNQVIKQRIKNAELYEHHLDSSIKKPFFSKTGDHIYYTYTIMTNWRDQLKNYLTKNKIETKIQHPKIISQHPGLKSLYNKDKDFPNGKKIIKSILSIPIHEKLSKQQLISIIKKINYFINIKKKHD